MSSRRGAQRVVEHRFILGRLPATRGELCAAFVGWLGIRPGQSDRRRVAYRVVDLALRRLRDDGTIVKRGTRNRAPLWERATS